MVSIGIPTYNRANGNLKKVIMRALDQTYKNVEVIVSDNCSSDNTSEVVTSIKDPRLKYIRHEENIGPLNNFNHCLKVANGEYFQLFHDDDMIDKDFVECCISSLDDNQSVGVVFTGIRIIDENDNTVRENTNDAKGLSPFDFVLGWFKGKAPLYLPSTLYNTRALLEVGGFHSRKNLFPDLVPTFKIVAAYGRVDVKEVKASFRRHSSNMGSTTPIKDWVDDALYVLEVLYSLFPENKKVLKSEGRYYLCKNMYQRMLRRPKKDRRPLDYWMIYQSFGFCYSPLSFFYKSSLPGRVVGKMKKSFK